jgi:hypothetical protein
MEKISRSIFWLRQRRFFVWPVHLNSIDVSIRDMCKKSFCSIPVQGEKLENLDEWKER